MSVTWKDERKTRLILAVILFFGLMWGVLSVSIHNALSGTTPGIDFYVFWMAGRAYFDHQNPYAPEVDSQIQSAIFEGPPPQGQDPMEFEYPPYVLLPLAVFTWLDFDWAQAAWLALNLLMLMAASYGLFSKGPRLVRLLFPFFYPMVFGLILGNVTITIAVFLMVFLKFMVEEKPVPVPAQVLLGVSLAWSSAKPQFVWLFLIVILLYGLRRRMWPFLTAFAGGLAALLALSFLFLPSWPALWLEQLRSYQSYSTILLDRYLAYLLPAGMIPMVSLLALAACAGVTVWLCWRWWRGQMEILLLLGWCGLVTFLVDLSIVAYEQLIFLIPLYLWAARQKPSAGLGVLWAAAWVLSYFLFFLDVQKILPRASDELPFLFYAAWLAWYGLAVSRRAVVMNVSPA